MGLKWTDEFRADSVRIALTSGLTRKQVADDLLPGRVLRSNVPKGGCWHVDAEQMDQCAPIYRCGFQRGFEPGSRE